MVPETQSETDRIFCHFGPFFSLYPPNNPENQKPLQDVIILNMCAKNHDHMMYAS